MCFENRYVSHRTCGNVYAISPPPGRLDRYFGERRLLQRSDLRPWPPLVQDGGYCAPSVHFPGRVPAIGRAFGVASELVPGG
jgi:hypothetical protein